jgi:hypothetical protein
MANQKTIEDAMPPLPAADNARRDAEAERDFEASVGIPSGETFEWLHDRVDGAKTPAPKPRKI